MTTQNHSNEQHIQQAKSHNSPPHKAVKPQKTQTAITKKQTKIKQKKKIIFSGLSLRLHNCLRKGRDSK